MGQHKLPRQPVAVPVVVTPTRSRSSPACTEVFRWVRKGIDLAEQTPEFLRAAPRTSARRGRTRPRSEICQFVSTRTPPCAAFFILSVHLHRRHTSCSSTGLAIFAGVAALLAKLRRRWMLRALNHDLAIDLAVSATTLAVHWGTF